MEYFFYENVQFSEFGGGWPPLPPSGVRPLEIARFVFFDFYFALFWIIFNPNESMNLNLLIDMDFLAYLK